MNHLKSLNTLKNQYFILRHGESIANQKELIVSSPENGVDNFGLSKEGRQQVNESIKSCSELNSKTKIISSDFLRAYESAKIAHRILNPELEIQINKSLRERFFGDHELKENTLYQNVWDKDQQDSSHSFDNVESADSVLSRTSLLVSILEQEHNNEVFLLVSHGDALQILQTAFSCVPASSHRSLAHLHTAEIRELVLKS